MFERLKQFTATTDRPEFECQRCGAGFANQRQVCPECGGFHIDRAEWGMEPGL